jgi:hypothetical protein
MKKRITFGVLAMCLYITMTATASYAQSGKVLMADVPFDFEVGGKLLPAGEYSVTPITSSEQALLIRQTDGNKAVMVLSNSAQGKENRSGKASLTFHRYGDQYFLALVQGPERAGRSIIESSRERSLRKEMRIAQRAGLAPRQMQLVTIAAR